LGTKPPVIMQNARDWQSATMFERSRDCSFHASSGVRHRAMRNGRPMKGGDSTVHQIEHFEIW